MNWWEALVLGFVQGLTEWLPVSSSGHLQITRALTGTAPSTWYDLLLHLGTLAVVVWVYRSRLVDLARAAFDRDHLQHRFAWGLAVGSIPIAAAGFLAKDVLDAAFANLWLVGLALLFTAYMLASTKGLDGRSGVNGPRAWQIGLWQALALLPGLSRSGAAIAGGLHSGLDRETATDFAFLLAIPALLGATLLKAFDAGAPAFSGPMVAGLLASLVTGYATLQWLRGIVARHGIHRFAPYCVAAGVFAMWLASRSL